ncbi:TPA: hypothetical protein PXE99_001834 [Mannheimia haemolytica]|nr:hypothetical protein [Mannheimia haemolytica]
MKPDYSDLKLKAQKVYNYSGSVQGRLSESLNTGVSVVGTGGNSLVIKGVQYSSNVAKGVSSAAQKAVNKIGEFAVKYPNAAGMVTDGTIALGVHSGYKVSTGQEINPYEAIGAFGSGALTRNQSVGNQIRINLGISTVTSLSKDPSGNSLGNDYFGAVISPVINKPFSMKDSALGNIVGGAMGEYGGDFDNRVKNYEELKKLLDNKGLTK